MTYLSNIPLKHIGKILKNHDIPMDAVRIDEFKDDPGVYYAYLKNGEHVRLEERCEAESDDFSVE